MKHFRTFLGNITWVGGQRGYIDIPRGNYLRRLILKIYGTYTLAAGAASGTVRSEAPATILDGVDVTGNDFGKLKTFDGSGLFLSTKLHSKVVFPVINGDGSADTHTELGIFTIDFALPFKGNIRPADTFLDTRRFSSLRLEVDFAANWRDAIYTGNDRTESDASGGIMVYAEYETPHGNFGEPLIYQQFMLTKNVAAAGTAFRFPMPVNYTYKNVILSAQNKAVSGQYTGNDAILTSYDLEFNANRFPIGDDNFVAHQYLDCLDHELTAIHAGCNFNIFDLDGMIKESIVTLNGSNLDYVMVVTTPAGDNEIRVYPGVLVRWPMGLRGEVCAPVAAQARAFTSKRVRALA